MNIPTPDNFKPFRWDGSAGKGAMKRYRAQKREDAIRRNAWYLERGKIPADPHYRDAELRMRERQGMAGR